ncbi:MAG: 50S ribosomal protein L29 [Deferribacterota bacterium]|nr:50S ribosomal protein L29 [Deferribacterota bacterium]
MNVSEIRELNINELYGKLTEFNEELFRLRFRLKTGELEDTSRISKTKKNIARIKTIIRAKEDQSDR